MPNNPGNHSAYPLGDSHEHRPLLFILVATVAGVFRRGHADEPNCHGDWESCTVTRRCSVPARSLHSLRSRGGRGALCGDDPQRWRVQNTLNDSHFFENGIELSPAGRIKVHSIVTEVPPSHRSVFVYRAETPDRTAAPHCGGPTVRGPESRPMDRPCRCSKPPSIRPARWPCPSALMMRSSRRYGSRAASA